MSIFKSIGKIAKSVIKSPILKVGVSGLAVAFPVVGIPAAAGVAAAGKIVDAAQGKAGTPAQQASAKRAVANTIVQAKQGDASAQRALTAMKKAQVAKALVSGMSKQEPGYFVDRSGRFRRVG